MTDRRFLPLVLLIALALGAVAAPARAAQTAQTTRYDVKHLTATWVLDTSTPEIYRVITVDVVHRTDIETGEVTLTASAGRGICDMRGESSCGTFMDPYRVVKFEADDAFSTATVVLRRGGQRHRITWQATTPFAWTPPFAENPNMCGGTTKTIYVSGMNATAEGRVFGRNVSTAGETDANDGWYRESENMVHTLEVEECT